MNPTRRIAYGNRCAWGKHEVFPVVEFEGVKTDFHRSLGVKHRPRNSAMGLLSLTEREGQSWQRQTVELYDLLNRVLYRVSWRSRTGRGKRGGCDSGDIPAFGGASEKWRRCRESEGMDLRGRIQPRDGSSPAKPAQLCGNGLDGTRRRRTDRPECESGVCVPRKRKATSLETSYEFTDTTATQLHPAAHRRLAL